MTQPIANLAKIDCPHCRGRLMDVSDSRPRDIYGIRVIARKRTCADCGEVVRTIEMSEIRFMHLRKEIARKLAAMLEGGEV